MQKPKVTIAIPAYNSQNTIAESIESALDQTYPLKEILVCDDYSSDNTVEIVESFGVRVIKNDYNMGIGKNLEKLMTEAKGRYILYLCSDDLLVNPNTLTDIVKIFDTEPSIGVIGRYYYFFMDGHKGAIGVCREKNILLQSCCPSGMAFRKRDIKGTNRIFVEMPTMVAQYLPQYRWTMLEYDTIAARFHPGGNTGTKTSYYTESPTQNWIALLGQNYQDFPMFVQLKNRAPKLLLGEIWLHIKNDKKVLSMKKFWFYALVALIIPSSILRKLTLFYRNTVGRRYAKIIERPKDEKNTIVGRRGFHIKSLSKSCLIKH